ncbi:MAG: Nif3-like dinuclear metal center hexameric protein [Cyclobacteriaceae bacterium]|nr:Nif3-like dinuclear metal center hexameric protein [Cyclobacteriaceae bacterium]
MMLLRTSRLVCSALLILLPAPYVAAQEMTARELIQKIRENVTVEWADETVDTFKAGDPDQKVTGIATTFIATADVLKRARDLNCNLIITHEPTFYNHLDETDHLHDDPVYQAKMKFIEDNGLIIFRFHDHIHRTDPDGIIQGVLDHLNWHKNVISMDPVILEFPKMFVNELAQDLTIAFDKYPMHVIGDPKMSFTRAAFAPGAPGYMAHIRLLQRDDVDVVIGGEVPEWESVLYVRDAAALNMNKAMILIGHVNSEEEGMKYCRDWLKNFLPGIPVHFVPAGTSFYVPK